MIAYETALQNPLRASVMYPPDRRLFRPFRVDAYSLEGLGSRVGLYAHVPFCETKCTYCDYETVPLGKYDVDAYVDALCAELRATIAALPKGTELTGFDIGGGTPGALSLRQFERVLREIDRAPLAPGFEISTETTPTLAVADPEKWRALARAGIARVSMGVQTDDEVLLTRLNRAPHVVDRVRRGIDALRSFALVNLDLMFALPGQRHFDATVAFAISLAPDVITIYDTVYKNRAIARATAPTREDYRRQYDAAFERLNAAGYRGRYGTVNFSRRSDRLGTSRYLESRILDGCDYLGTGLYASSLHGTTWRFGKKSYRAYTANPGSCEDIYALPIEHVMAKYVLLALSYGHIDRDRFFRRFGEPIEARFGRVLEFLVASKLLDEDLALVAGRFGELPGIRALFYPEDALAWLEVPVR